MNRPPRPWLALSGGLFFLFGLLGQLLAPTLPDFAAPVEQIVTFYEEEGTSLLGPAVLWMLAGAALLAFVGFLHKRSRDAEGEGGALSSIALAGGVAAGAITIAGASLMAMSALRVDENGAIDPAVATASFDFSTILYGAAFPMALAVLVLAVAALSLRHALFPGWVGAVSVVLGVALLAVPIAYFSAIAFNFWALLLAVLLFLEGSPERATGSVGREATV